MFWNLVYLVLGMVLLVKGADWFVDGSSKIAKALKIPSIIIGLTLVSMGTSAPEAAVSLTAAFKGLDDSSVANVVGSDIFNTLFILGASSLFVPLFISKDMKKYDIPVMVGSYVLLILFSFVISPLKIELFESLILLTCFIGYMAFLIYRTKKEQKEKATAGENIEEEKQEKQTAKQILINIAVTLGGLVCIVLGGTIVVDNAEIIAKELGMSDWLIGLTILAVGTSLPELVTSIVASIKKENEIAVGNIIGSNIFNILFILGISSAIFPLSTTTTQMFDMFVMLGTGLLVLITSLFTKKINRWQGIVWIVLYVAYLVFIIIRN